jgi:excisionase family DNA binding protein
VPQVACALGVSKNTAYRLVKDHTIGCKHIGRKIIVPKACLVDFILSARYNKDVP